MLVSTKKQFLFLFIFLLCFCNKADTEPPTITISSPLNNETFQIPCNINVIGTTQDNTNIDRIEIDLVSENSAAIIQKLEIDADTNYFKFDISLAINDRLLNSGNYYLNIKSFDENQNISSSYISLNINELPRFLVSQYYILGNHNQAQLYELDSNSNLQLRYPNIGNYKSSLVNSKHQYFFFLNDQMGWSIDPINFNSLWDLSSNISFFNLFTGISKTNNNDQTHLCFSDGRLFTINKEGNIINAIYSNNQESFGAFYVDNDLVLVESYSNTIQKQIVVFFRQSGIEKKRINIDADVIKIIPINHQQYMIIANQLNKTFLNIYDENLNILFTETELLNSEVLDVFKLNNHILLGTSNGVLTYNLDLKTLNNLNPNLVAQKFVYDEHSENLFLICGKELWNYSSISNLNLVNTFNDSIKDYLLLYNK